MPHRRNIVYFIIFTLLFWTIGPLMVYIVDPYHIFHETRWNKNLWFGNKTLINLGQIETYLKRSNDYDGILVGSSYSMNFQGSDLAKAVGAKGVLKLCDNDQPIDCGMNWVKICADTHKLKHCFVVRDAICYSWFTDQPLIRKEFYVNHPKCSLWNVSSFLALARRCAHELKFKLEHKELWWLWKDISEVHRWYEYRLHNFVTWINPYCLSQLKHSAKDFKNYAINQQDCAVFVHHFNDVLLRTIKENSSIIFYVMLGPCAFTQPDMYLNCITNWTADSFYNTLFNGWRHLITACADLPNVKIYGWHDCAFVSNIANYCDESHYHPDINRYMAWCIEHDKHRLTKENYDAYEARCVENLRAFKILDSYPHRDTFDELVAAEMQDGN